MAAGWALQKPRGDKKRFSENVRSYLTARFDAGVTGRKADTRQVSNDMTKARNNDGSRKFTRDEWLTKTQVQSFFSRLSAARKKQKVILHPDESDEELLEEEHNFLKEKNRREQVNDMLSQLGIEHPIVYDGYDICDRVKSGLISKFNVKTLKSICEHFELTFKSRDTKAALLSKITEMVKECEC